MSEPFRFYAMDATAGRLVNRIAGHFHWRWRETDQGGRITGGQVELPDKGLIEVELYLERVPSDAEAGIRIRSCEASILVVPVEPSSAPVNVLPITIGEELIRFQMPAEFLEWAVGKLAVRWANAPKPVRVTKRPTQSANSIGAYF